MLRLHRPEHGSGRGRPHPRDWAESGDHEIQRPPERYRSIDRDALCELLGIADERLAIVQSEWSEASLRRGPLKREKQWSEAVAVGRKGFGEEVQEKLGARAVTGVSRRSTTGSPCAEREELYRPGLSLELGALSAKRLLDVGES